MFEIHSGITEIHVSAAVVVIFTTYNKNNKLIIKLMNSGKTLGMPTSEGTSGIPGKAAVVWND